MNKSSSWDWVIMCVTWAACLCFSPHKLEGHLIRPPACPAGSRLTPTQQKNGSCELFHWTLSDGTYTTDQKVCVGKVDISSPSVLQICDNLNLFPHFYLLQGHSGSRTNLIAVKLNHVILFVLKENVTNVNNENIHTTISALLLCPWP